ncbi:AMP deaminase, partial [Dipsacomyces acuminosporus]
MSSKPAVDFEDDDIPPVNRVDEEELQFDVPVTKAGGAATGDEDPEIHPFVTYNSLASSTYEAGPSFVNAYFAKHPFPHQSKDPLEPPVGTQTPDPSSIQQQQQQPANSADHGPAAAALIKSKKGLPHAHIENSKNEQSGDKPRSILVSQRLLKENKDSVAPQLLRTNTATRIKQATAATDVIRNYELDVEEEIVDIGDDAQGSTKSASILPRQAEAALAQDPDIDDDATSRKIEDEIRDMMRKVHVKDASEALRGMNEGPEELKRIGDALVRCMELRDKYMDISLQHEIDNPKNKPDWKIYPSPPKPAWHNFAKRTVDKDEEFDMSKCEIPRPDDSVFEVAESGVYQVYENEELRAAGEQPFTRAPSIKEFYMDLDFVLDTISDGPIKTWAFRRLRYLDARWQLYFLLNEREEAMQSKMVPHRDLYNVRKVDGHVHLASAMNQKHLLRFIKYKLKTEPDKPVIVRDGQTLTLRQVFESLNLTAYDLSIDTLDMHAHKGAYHRFDKFNLKYNPIGESRLRTIFMKSDNHIDGEYFAQITKEVASDLEQSKYQMAEYRISIYGRSEDEWDKLAAWVVDNKIFSSNVRWLIQTPRLYNIYKAGGQVDNFEQVIVNIFKPLFEVTKDPSSHPKLH